MERSILDAIRSKEQIDKQVFTESIKSYFSSKNRNFLRLADYAEKMNLKKEVQIYSEMLL